MVGLFESITYWGTVLFMRIYNVSATRFPISAEHEMGGLSIKAQLINEIWNESRHVG